jgi:guanine deaminase
VSPDELMRLAIDAARRGILAGQSPFGCAIAYEGRIVAACHNTVWLTTDITAHAEVNAIREACRRRRQILLEGCVVASTCEPCPMCMSALHWARVKTVYFGATIADAATAGFRELAIPAATVVQLGKSPVELVEGILAEKCRELFRQWKQSAPQPAY